MVKTERYYSGQYSLVEPDPNASHYALDTYDDRTALSYPPPAAASGSLPPRDNFYGSRRGGSFWNRWRKFIIIGGIALLVVIVVVAVAVGVTVSQHHKTPFVYTPRDDQVTNSSAFESGAATKSSPNNTADGIGAGSDSYTYYSGPASNFPNSSTWISFEDMWQGNLHNIRTSCKTEGYHSSNSDADIQDIYDAIQNRASSSLVDHRYILAIILQESKGCVYVGSTTSSSGVRNPGLMQSHNGSSFDSANATYSILAMVQDGVQGTAYGEGLVQNLNNYGDAYSAARGYNSGYLPKSGNLSEAAGATACYVSDVANRLTGWANATSKCPGDTS